MVLEDLAWPDVRDLSRDLVVVIPTGAHEQHGPHLPLSTDNLLTSAVARAVEQLAPEAVLLTPLIWLGLSHAHRAFDGSLTASFEGYEAELSAIIEELLRQGFRRFFVLNGHGGNTASNANVLRRFKASDATLTLAHHNYWEVIPSALADILDDPVKVLNHGGEAETSLVLLLRPELVKMERARIDGLSPERPVPGAIYDFDELTEEGSQGHAHLGTAEKGRRILEAAAAACVETVRALAGPVVFRPVR
jgi:creatinine amidohydrolase